MRGLFFSNLFPSKAQPNRGTFSLQQLRSCAESIDFQILVPIPWTTFRNFDQRLWTSNSEFDVTYFPYYYPPGILRQHYGTFVHLSAKKWYQKIAEFDPEFVLASFVYPDGFAAAKVAADLEIPLAVQALGSDIKVHSLDIKRRRRILTTLAQSAKVFAVSQDLGRDMCAIGAETDKVTVNYNGVDMDKFYPIRVGTDTLTKDLAPARDKSILFVGNLIKTKGIFELLSSFKRLITHNNALRLTIIGSGNEEETVRQMIASHGLSDSVCLAGYVANDELPDWYRSADVFCLPSYSEGVPNVVMEAIACGTPVVASDVGGISEIVHEDNGILVSPKSVSELTAALRSSLDKDWDPPKVSETVTGFTWKKYGDQLYSNLQSMCEDHSLAR